jgi:hypothetical protein
MKDHDMISDDDDDWEDIRNDLDKAHSYIKDK